MRRSWLATLEMKDFQHDYLEPGFSLRVLQGFSSGLIHTERLCGCFAERYMETNAFPLRTNLLSRLKTFSDGLLSLVRAPLDSVRRRGEIRRFATIHNARLGAPVLQTFSSSQPLKSRTLFPPDQAI